MALCRSCRRRCLWARSASTCRNCPGRLSSRCHCPWPCRRPAGPRPTSTRLAAAWGKRPDRHLARRQPAGRPGRPLARRAGWWSSSSCPSKAWEYPRPASNMPGPEQARARRRTGPAWRGRGTDLSEAARHAPRFRRWRETQRSPRHTAFDPDTGGIPKRPPVRHRPPSAHPGISFLRTFGIQVFLEGTGCCGGHVVCGGHPAVCNDVALFGHSGAKLHRATDPIRGCQMECGISSSGAAALHMSGNRCSP